MESRSLSLSGVDWSHNTRFLATFGEACACAYLIARGYVILSRNFRTHLGELDIVAKEDDCVVVVEVKTRLAAPRAGELLFANVGRRKREKLVRLADFYMNHVRSSGVQASRPEKCTTVESCSVRVDLVGVIVDPSSKLPLSKPQVRIYHERCGVMRENGAMFEYGDL